MHAVKSTSATVKTLRAKRANENAICKPQHDIQYSYDEGGWSKEAENNYTYNAQGLVLTQLQNAGDYAISREHIQCEGSDNQPGDMAL